ncbi:MAG: amidohydrolase [Saprospiraceae bacterium]
MSRFFILLFILFLGFLSCKNTDSQFADTILTNGKIYTVDSLNPVVESIAILNDTILALGSNEEIQKMKGPETEVIDLDGRFTLPGLIEGHGHFGGMGKSLLQLNFLKARSWQEIVDQVAEAAKNAKPGDWIEGRGWHQEKWDSTPAPNVKGYPYNDALNAVSPDNPVVLRHASGHGVMANAKAMELAGISLETPDPSGGEIVRNSNGNAIGMFEERAMHFIMDEYKAYLDSLSREQLMDKWLEGIFKAQDLCLEMGITSFQDAGTTPGIGWFHSYEELAEYQRLAEEGKLKIRMWAMLREDSETLEKELDEFPKIGLGNDHFTCKAIKSELDGALGSYGAWLLEDYSDKPGFKGQNTTPLSEIEKIAQQALAKDMQLCVHGIGDRGNHEILNLFEAVFKAHPDKKDLRWRVEHAQHLDPADIPRFKELGVIAAMQGIHCTSDAPFVEKRLGEKRATEGAYAWRALLDAGATVGNGTDVPVEDINPFENFYATITRERHQAKEHGLVFHPEQAMSREEAIYSYTMANAYAAFEEKIKGSLEPGKLADIIVLSNDLLTCTEEEILDTKVLMTMVGGKIFVNHLN